MPFGGIKMAEEACQTYGYEPDPELHKIFTEYSRTHNQAVFDAYTPEMKRARQIRLSPACRTPMAAAALWAITAAWRCMAWTS